MNKLTDNQIADIILDDLKTKSPRNLITDILKPRQLWDKTQEQRIKNIVAILTSKNLITPSSDRYFPGTDIKLTINEEGLNMLNRFNSYSSFLQSQAANDKGFNHNIIGDNFQGNTIFIGDGNVNHSQHHLGNSQTNIVEQPINHSKKDKNKSAIISLLIKYWWAFVVPTLGALLVLAIEYNWFVNK